jgi:hypothetical protein
MIRFPLKFLPLAILVAANAASLSAQPAPSISPADATVCDILAAPKSFDGKIVRIKGTVIAGFDEFGIRDASCNGTVNTIWLSYPEGTKGKAGPIALLTLQAAKNSPGEAPSPRPAVTLDKNPDFIKFDTLLSTPIKLPGRCLGCVRSTVTATLIGRLDGVASAGLERDPKGMFTSVSGFGNLNRYSARLVLQSVTDVTAQDIDFAKAAKLPKEDGDNSKGDPVAGAHEAARFFGAGNPAGTQIERAALAFGKPGEDNGVVVGFGTLGELRAADEGKGAAASPEGLLYLASFDASRLKGKALSEAIVHSGQLIADIRAGQFTDDIYQLEGRAWQTTVLSAVAFHEKTLTLPDGSIVWNSNWTNDERGKAIAAAIDSYLTLWSGFGR